LNNITQHASIRRRLCATLAATGFISLGGWAQAAEPINLVVPFPPGGPTDVVARTVAQQMSHTLGQHLIVANRAGAGGSIGAAAVAQAAPDGQTLLTGTASLTTGHHLYNLNFHPLKDLVPVAMLAKMPVFIWVRGDSPYNTLPDLLEAMKASNGQYNYSSSAPTTLAHLGSLRLLDETGVQATHVNYRGSAQATTDFLAGVFPVYFEVGQPLAPHYAAGKAKPLAVLSSQRSTLMPDVPSVTEFGLPAIDAKPFVALMAPAGTPEATLVRLNEHARKALQSPEVRSRLDSLYFEVDAGGSPAEVATWLQEQSSMWGEVIAKHGLKVD